MAENKQDPEYLLVHTDSELERLRKQHAWMERSLGGKIVWAPIDMQKDGLKVLDVGCADGTLLRDLQKQLSPSAQLVGADVMPSFLPKDDPSGHIRYVLQDIGKPFATDLQDAFDFTHVRWVLAGAAQAGIETAIKHLASSLAPGGWLQVMEMDTAEDIPGQTQAIKDMFFITRALFAKIGMGARWVDRLEPAFKDAGLENVTVHTIELKVGKKMGNEKDSRASIEPNKLTLPSLINACKNVGANLPASVTDNLIERFEKEMMEQGGTMTALVVTGQKSP